MATTPKSVGMRVLLAEDNRTLRRFMVRALSKAGFEVLECVDGRQAVGTMEASSVDFVITDIEMPHVDGFGVLEWARQNRRKVPCLAITGNPAGGVCERCLKLGAVACLAKPLDVVELISYITTLALQPPPATDIS